MYDKPVASGEGLSFVNQFESDLALIGVNSLTNEENSCENGLLLMVVGLPYSPWQPNS